MKIVIIEDEALMAQDLAEILEQQPGHPEVRKILSSVAESVSYLREADTPDLIFSDIQLGDGLSFDIFRQVKTDCPVIFCTAYDEFALEAFRNNGIDYILKPFTRLTIKEALNKYQVLRENFTRNTPNYPGLFSSPGWTDSHRKNSSLLVTWKDKIIPIRIPDIALFTIDYKMTQLVTFDNQKYYINQTLEELEQTCGPAFYRANRQYLVNKDSILEALQYFARKLVLKLKIEGKHEVVISKNRVPEFLEWLKN
jgi:two-component system, LytTR family, response regulator LytT